MHQSTICSNYKLNFFYLSILEVRFYSFYSIDIRALFDGMKLQRVYSNSLVIRQKTYLCVSWSKKYLFFGKFGELCFLVTSIVRFTLSPYYRRIYHSKKYYRVEYSSEQSFQPFSSPKKWK